MGQLDGRVALITGGGRGQGRAHAFALAREGCAIALCDFTGQLASVDYRMNDGGELPDTAAALRKDGARAISIEADVRSLDQMHSAASRAVAEFGRIDILCANAGSWASSPIAEMSPSVWNDTLDTNLTGTFNSIRAVVPYMIREKFGRIVATASALAKRPVPGMAAYTAAKRGVLGLVDALSAELGPHNITVNALCPSVVKTGMSLNSAFAKALRSDLAAPTFEDAALVLSKLTRLGVAAADVEDLSRALLFFVCESGRLVTGVALDVNPLL